MNKLSFGAEKDLLNAPIIHGLEHSPALRDAVRLKTGSSEECCQALLDRSLDAAIITSRDYIAHSKNLEILPQISLASRGSCNLALLFFRENLASISRIATPVFEDQYLELAKLVMAEFYELTVDWHPAQPAEQIEQLLAEYPACFLSGLPAMNHAYYSDQFIDLLEDWSDKTQLPFVHRVVATRRHHNTEALSDLLYQSLDLGWRNLGNISRTFAESSQVDWIYYYDILSTQFKYLSEKENWDGVRKYTEYLFYHGFIEDIPEIRLGASNGKHS